MVGRAANTFKLYKQHEPDWNFRRTLQQMHEKGAEIGECLYAASRIDETDGRTWIDAWGALGDRLRDDADTALKGGHRISARELYLRACNMYRAAEYGTPPRHPRFQTLWQKSVDSFQSAAVLYDPPVEAVEIPYEDKLLPGYFWRPDKSGKDRPTLFAAGGNDSSIEEIFNFIGPAAARRGYNFFTFDYPGHRGAVHTYPECVRRPDFEVPFKAAFDWLERQPGVDKRIALTGYSGGGAAVVRVGCFEQRIAALIPNSPLVDQMDIGKKFWSWILKMPGSVTDMLFEKKMKKNPVSKAFFEYSRWIMPYNDLPLKEYTAKILEETEYNNRPYLHQIKCPTLALVGDGEGQALREQAEEYYNKVSSKKKDIYVFTLEKDGTYDHCQLDNRTRGNQITFDWLDDLFDYRYEDMDRRL